jgi:hypothetical protein
MENLPMQTITLVSFDRSAFRAEASAWALSTPYQI